MPKQTIDIRLFTANDLHENLPFAWRRQNKNWRINISMGGDMNNGQMSHVELKILTRNVFQLRVHARMCHKTFEPHAL